MGLNKNYKDLFIGIDTPVHLENGDSIIPINFDNGATTPPMKASMNAIYDNALFYGAVARGAGQKGEFCTKKYEDSRDSILEFFNLKDTNKQHDGTYSVVYTKNVTEAINLLAKILIKNKTEKVLTTRMEHHANDLPWRRYSSVEYIDIDSLGRINIDTLEKKLTQSKGSIKFVSITGASNVTGYVNDIHTIAKICHKYHAKIIVDAAQLVAHREINMKGYEDNNSDAIDFLVFSAHKAYAPFGSGAIVGLSSYLSDVDPLLVGGGCVDGVFDYNFIWNESPHLHEAGTSNFLGVMAMVEAFKTLKEVGFEDISDHEMQIKNYLIDEMKKIDNIILYGDIENTQDRLGVIPFNIKDIPYTTVSSRLADEFGIATRCGKFCAHPYVDRLLGLSDEDAYKDLMDNDCYDLGMIRLSLGLYNSLDEAKIFIHAIKYIASN